VITVRRRYCWLWCLCVVKLLLERSVDIKAKDGYGHTLLSCAAKNGHEAVVKLLLGMNAGIDAKDEDGQTPLL
jgi:ankyrin repeat protein